MQSRIHRFKSAAPAALLLVAGTAAIGATAAGVVTARQAHFKDLGKAFKAINDQLKSGTPDMAVIKANAPIVAKIGAKLHHEDWFPKGTEPGKGLQTTAAPAIWQNAPDFNAKRADFAKVSANFPGVAATGDIEAIKASVAAIGKTCKGCHDSYRSQDKS